MASPDRELLDALGLAGATVIDAETYEKLPEHRRHFYDSGRSRERRYVYLQLADPPEVAALREVAEALVSVIEDTRAAGGDLQHRVLRASGIALRAVEAWERGVTGGED